MSPAILSNVKTKIEFYHHDHLCWSVETKYCPVYHHNSSGPSGIMNIIEHDTDTVKFPKEKLISR